MRRGKREKYRRINFVRVGMRDRAIVNRRRSITEIASRSTKSRSRYEIQFLLDTLSFASFRQTFQKSEDLFVYSANHRRKLCAGTRKRRSCNDE